VIYKQIAVRKPRLLDKDLNEVKRLQPDMQTIELNITPLSTASLSLADGSGVRIRSFVELYNAKGSVGIFRVSLPEESYGGGERVTLEHGICVLDDAVVSGMGKIKGTPREVLTSILTHQTTKARGQYMWALGNVEAPDDMQISVDHDGTKTLEMLSRVMQELDGYMLSFDQSVFPWLVHVRKKPEKAACEGRLSRNIRTIRRTMDDSDQCTRLICSLLDGGYIESDTIDVWGEIEKEITLNDDMPKEDAATYCRRYLDNRKNPAVSIEMDADEWFAMTGERLDRFENGDICLLALPEYGVVIEERIVSMTYMDALGKPEAVTVSLANQVVDMSIKTAEMAQQLGNLQGTSTRYGNQIRQNNTTIAHLKEENEGFKEIDNKVVKWFSKAEINLDADETGANVGILATYKETHDLFDEVGERVSEAELVLHGGPGNAQAGLIAKVNGNTAELLLQANELGTLATVKADKVDLGKYATVERLESELENFELSLGDSMTLRTLNVTGATSTDSLFVDARASVGSLTVDGTPLKLLTRSVLNGNTTISVNASGGVVTGVTLNRKYTEFHYLGYE
jgi:hypothetical protein